MTFTIETPANNKKGWRKLADCEFQTQDKAEAYGIKYHTDKHGSRLFRVVELKEKTDAS